MKRIFILMFVMIIIFCSCSNDSVSNVKNNSIAQPIGLNANKSRSRTFANNLQVREPEYIDTPLEMDIKRRNESERSVDIESEVKKMNGIKNASVVIMGASVLVGISTYDNLDDKQVIALKRAVEKRVKEVDSKISNVAVTSTPELVTRISEIENRTANGFIEN